MISFAQTGLNGFVRRRPSDESLGYCQSSLRDFREVVGTAVPPHQRALAASRCGSADEATGALA